MQPLNLDSSPSQISRIIQRGLIPRVIPGVAGYDVAAGTSLEDDGPGGTVWDFAPLAGDRIALLALNVQGDGLPPGHYLAVARGLLRELGKDQESLEGLLARVNAGLAAASIEGMDQYVEAGVLLPRDGTVEWAGAGGCLGGVIRRSGIFEEFSSHGPPLGMLEGFLYGTQRLDVGVGDAVIVLSKGSPGIFRGAADLAASLQGKPVGEVVSTIQKALRKAQEDGPVETSILFIRRQ